MLDAEDTINVKSDKTMTELDLSKIFVPDIPKDVIFPEELNSYLRDQIQYLTHENGMLRNNLSDKELKLHESHSQLQVLNKQVQNYENIVPTNNFTSVSTVASSKIVELSKKLREKSSELEVVKTKCSKLEHQIFVLHQREHNDSVETEKGKPLPEKEKPTNELEDQVKELQDKLSNTNNKLFETRNLNVKLKNELKLANKCVQQEIGDTLENVKNTGANWRGRAQIICDLQQKNNELREKLKSCQGNKPVEAPVPSKPDRRLEILSRENSVLKTELQEIKRRLDGARARSKLFESEASVLRAKVTALSEQQENDRNLIAVLTSQLSNTKGAQQEDNKQKDLRIQKLERDYKTVQLELIKEKCRFDNLQKEAREKDLEIDELKNAKLSNSIPPNNVDQRVVGRLEAERMRLLELTEIANKRLEVERNSYANIQLQLRAERQKSAKLEAKISRLQLEYSDRNSLYSLHSGRPKEANRVAEDRLVLAEENIKALQARLQMEQQERKMDFDVFSQILKNYTPTNFEYDE